MRILSLLALAALGGATQVQAHAKIVKPHAKTFQMGSKADLDVYFVRHGETIANATGRYNSKTLQAFSEKGAKQVQALVPMMHSVRIDYAICSPALRVENTASGVLRDHHIKAEVWPELNECCTQPKSQRGQPAHGLRYTGNIGVPKVLADVLTVPSQHAKMIADGNYNDGLLQVQACVQRFKSTFIGKSGSVAVFGHAAEGGQFLYALTGRRLQVRNAQPIHLRRTDGGSYVVVPQGRVGLQR